MDHTHSVSPGLSIQKLIEMKDKLVLRYSKTVNSNPGKLESSVWLAGQKYQHRYSM